MIAALRRRVRLGSRVLRIRRAFHFGLRSELDTWRAKRRYLPHVASLPPLPSGEGPFDCFMLLNEARAWEGIWALYSFRLHAGPCRVTVLSDGTLTPETIALLGRALPGLTCPEAAANRDAARAELVRMGLVRCSQWLDRFVLFQKLIDPFRLARSEKIVLLDSDTLHFRRPVELHDWLLDPAVPRFAMDAQPHALCINPEEFERMAGMRPAPFFNSGYLSMLRTAVSFRRVEAYLQEGAFESQLTSGQFAHVAEQTIFAMELSRLGAAPLPATYSICPDVPADNAVMGHFCGGESSRNWFYTKGLAVISRQLSRGDQQTQ